MTSVAYSGYGLQPHFPHFFPFRRFRSTLFQPRIATLFQCFLFIPFPSTATVFPPFPHFFYQHTITVFQSFRFISFSSRATFFNLQHFFHQYTIIVFQFFSSYLFHPQQLFHQHTATPFPSFPHFFHQHTTTVFSTFSVVASIRISQLLAYCWKTDWTAQTRQWKTNTLLLQDGKTSLQKVLSGFSLATVIVQTHQV